MKFSLKFLIIILVLCLCLFLNKLIPVKSSCPSGVCPWNPQQPSNPPQQQEESDHPHENNQHPPQQSPTASTSSTSTCPANYCTKSDENGHCPPPCQDDKGNWHYCCCVKESLEALDERIKTGNMLKTDEPIGFIQRCICKEFSSPCKNDEECMGCSVDPYEKDLYPKVCGEKVLRFTPRPPSSTPPISYSFPEIGSYKFETDLFNFIKKVIPNLQTQENFTITFNSEQNPFMIILYALIRWGLKLSGVILFIVIVYSGVMYSLSGGDPKKKQEAQTRIIEALIGFFLLFGFYIILNTINPNILKTNISGPSTPPPTPSQQQSSEEGTEASKEGTEETGQESGGAGEAGQGSGGGTGSAF